MKIEGTLDVYNQWTSITNGAPSLLFTEELDFLRQGVPLRRVSYSRIQKTLGGGGEYWSFLSLKKVLRGGGGFSPKAPPVNAPLRL